MVYPHEWLLQSASVFWIFTLLLSESHSKQSQIFYMEAKDCGNKKPLGGAVVYSHSQESGDNYLHDISCQITFQAKDDHWRLMLRVIELDIPDRTPNGYCNDALYVFDDSTSYTVAMKDAGGIGGLCGSILPPTLKSTGRYMTVVFRTGAEGPVGRGFKYIITAFNEDYEKQGTCGSDFQCDNKLCVEESLLCDGIDNCGDYSDEAASGRARCKEECRFICKFLSLGVTASIFISVGSIVIVVSCVVAVVCCCRRFFCRKSQEHSNNTSGGSVITTATTVVANGTSHAAGGTVGSSSYSGSRAPSAFSNHAYSHQGYYPMQPVYPTPHGSVYSYAKDPYAPPGSAYSSQQSQHRSYTPTSSKSGKSNRSNNSTSVTYSQGTEKVSLPINL